MREYQKKPYIIHEEEEGILGVKERDGKLKSGQDFPMP
jgi:hypothetical protein